ncbi:MAG TPA: hypothetical protein VFV66_13110 [Nonomuraea sp.]|nr:hypothetical protein [Nonomuraea sp.]
MSSKNADVTVTARQGTTLWLRIVSADGQEAAVPREDFALMLIEEAAEAHPDRECPFAKEVSFEDVIDERWLRRFARGFVRSVRVTDSTAGQFPSSVLHVEVTHPAWLSHIHEGDTWESHAYETGAEFADCAPIVPAETGAVSDDAGDSFIHVPRAAWRGLLETGPELLEVPAYSPSAYTTRDTVHDPDQIPAEWIGRAVRIIPAHGSGVADGALVNESTWATMDPHGFGFGTRIRSIARLVPNSRRRGGRLTYAQVLTHVKPELVGARQNGGEVELSFRIPPDRRELALYEPSHVLRLLTLGWDGDHDDHGERAGRTALADALAADAARLGGDDRRDLLARVADSYVAHYTITHEPGHDLDALPAHQVRTILTAAWPTATLAVTMTDARWATLPDGDEWPQAVEDALGTHALGDRP